MWEIDLIARLAKPELWFNLSCMKTSSTLPTQIITEMLERSTKGAGDFLDVTKDLQATLSTCGLKEGLLTVFVIGSTAGIVTFEFEPGLIQDMREIYEKMAPSNKTYAHNATWQDDNGFAHIRSALQGTSLAIPFHKGKLLLGTWQQVVLAEFDNRPRQRKIAIQMIGQ